MTDNPRTGSITATLAQHYLILTALRGHDAGAAAFALQLVDSRKHGLAGSLTSTAELLAEAKTRLRIAEALHPQAPAPDDHPFDFPDPHEAVTAEQRYVDEYTEELQGYRAEVAVIADELEARINAIDPGFIARELEGNLP